MGEGGKESEREEIVRNTQGVIDRENDCKIGDKFCSEKEKVRPYVSAVQA